MRTAREISQAWKHIDILDLCNRLCLYVILFNISIFCISIYITRMTSSTRSNLNTALNSGRIQKWLSSIYRESHPLATVPRQEQIEKLWTLTVRLQSKQSASTCSYLCECGCPNHPFLLLPLGNSAVPNHSACLYFSNLTNWLSFALRCEKNYRSETD